MSAPVVSSISFDKTAYNPGDTITATFLFTPGSSAHSFTLTGTATDSATHEVGSLTSVFTVAETDATTVAASSADSTGNPDGRVWALVSQDAGSAVFTSTA